MATRFIEPMQSDLRAFIIYDHLPPGCIAFPILTDDSVPHLRPGDVAVVDTSDREPSEGELFVIEWGRNAPCGPTRHVIDLFTRWITPTANTEALSWWAGPYSRPRSQEAAMAEARRTGILRGTVDGPYAHRDYPHAGDPDGDYLPSLLIGRVVGIFASRFEEPRRLQSPL